MNRFGLLRAEVIRVAKSIAADCEADGGVTWTWRACVAMACRELRGEG